MDEADSGNSPQTFAKINLTSSISQRGEEISGSQGILKVNAEMAKKGFCTNR
jgi:hypothetical protein